MSPSPSRLSLTARQGQRSVSVFLYIMGLLVTLAISLEWPSLQSGGSISLLWLVTNDMIRQRSAQGTCQGLSRSQQSQIDDSMRGSATPWRPTSRPTTSWWSPCSSTSARDPRTTAPFSAWSGQEWVELSSEVIVRKKLGARKGQTRVISSVLSRS